MLGFKISRLKNQIALELLAVLVEAIKQGRFASDMKMACL
jgi:hypothetical protein